jgi:hypothetical protein
MHYPEIGGHIHCKLREIKELAEEQKGGVDGDSKNLGGERVRDSACMILKKIERTNGN